MMSSLSNLHCLKASFRLKCNKNQWHSSLNLVSQQLKFCNIYFRNGVSEWMIHCCLGEEYFPESTFLMLNKKLEDPFKIVAFMLLKLSWGKFYDCD